jgi:hypothetical protein
VASFEIRFEPSVIVHASGRFPGQAEKERLFLIISEYSKTPANETFVCLPITSWEADDPFMIRISQLDMQKGYLKKPS